MFETCHVFTQIIEHVNHCRSLHVPAVAAYRAAGIATLTMTAAMDPMSHKPSVVCRYFYLATVCCFLLPLRRGVLPYFTPAVSTL